MIITRKHSLDIVMSHIQSFEMDKTGKWSKLLNLVVRDPELFKSVTNNLNTCQVLDEIPAKRQDLEVLHVVEVLNTSDHVGGQTQLLTGCQGSKSGVHLIFIYQMNFYENNIDIIYHQTFSIGG